MMYLLLRILPDQVCFLYPPRPAEGADIGCFDQLAEVISKQTMRTEDRMNRNGGRERGPNDSSRGPDSRNGRRHQQPVPVMGDWEEARDKQGQGLEAEVQGVRGEVLEVDELLHREAKCNFEHQLIHIK